MTKDEELELLRQENAALREELAQVKEQLHRLQEQGGKDSHNSSLPPSSDRFVRRAKSLRKKSGKKAGGQKGHRGHHLRQVDTPDEVVQHQVEWCAHCACNVRTQAACVPERRQVFELPAKRVWVVEHRVEEKGCPRCGKLTRAPFPAAVRAPAQYGAGIAALAVYLVQGQFVPYARAAEVMHDLLGVQMSAGSIARFVRHCHQPLEGVEASLKAALIQAPVLHQDETGLRVNGKTHAVHVACTLLLTHYGAQTHRGRTAMEAIGISPAFRGISVHDGWMSYRAFDCQHALCNAHHLRELIFIEETYQQEWAAKMKDLLLEIKAEVQAAQTRGQPALDCLTMARFSGDYDLLLAQGWQSNPPPSPSSGSRRRKQHPARTLLNRLQAGKWQVLAFATNFAVPFDNNQAERDLRMLKVQQKVSGGLRTEMGIQVLCRIRSYLSTLRKQKGDLLQALHHTLLGDPVLPAF
ncbi:MAG: IS66 family transposase [Ktedonobacteraceae bacterium]